MDSYGLEQDLKKLFVTFGPLQVMATWTKVVSDFRQALSEYDTKPTTVKFSDVIEPIMKNPIEVPAKPTPVHADKEAQKQKQKAHRDAVQKKREELQAKGIVPESQLTEENLKQWIHNEKKNYWTIAELTGCNDSDISNMAKTKNILSPVALMIRRQKAKV
jgi:hypothetical protein